MRRAEGFWQRLRPRSVTDLERRLLDAAGGERPSPELSERMAHALGLSGSAFGVATSAKVPAGAAAPKAAAGLNGLAPWVGVGVVSVLVASAFVATRALYMHPAGHDPSPTVGVPVTAASVSTPFAEVPSTAVAPVESSENPAGPAIPQRGRAGASMGDLRAQIALVDAARSAVSSGSPSRALENLRQYQDRYPGGSFRPEAMAIKVEALVSLGRSAEARALAERFIAEYGSSSLADHVSRLAGLTGPHVGSP